MWQPKVLPDGISSHQYSVHPYTRRALCLAAVLAASAADDVGQIGTGMEMWGWGRHGGEGGGG